MKKVFFGLPLISIVFILIRCENENYLNNPPISITGEITHVSLCGGNDGSIDLTVSGGTPPFTFQWSNNETTEDVSGLEAGIYSVLVTDSENQSESDTFEVAQPEADPLALIFEATNPSETGASDGAITIVVSGGVPPYSYLWSDGSTTANIENLTAGEYILTITDDIGQTLTDTVALTDCITDIDGNTYSVVKIGSQLWMRENLRVTHAPDSSAITSFAYDNDTNYVRTYGRLYTWGVAMNGSTEEKARGICPEGWHIPSDEEYKVLEMFLGMTQEEADMVNTWRGATVGTQLKVGGSSGFEALLSGRRAGSGAYSLLGRVEYLWTSTEYLNNAWRRCIDLLADDVGRWNTFPKTYGFSVRCMKDD